MEQNDASVNVKMMTELFMIGRESKVSKKGEEIGIADKTLEGVGWLCPASSWGGGPTMLLLPGSELMREAL